MERVGSPEASENPGTGNPLYLSRDPESARDFVELCADYVVPSERLTLASLITAPRRYRRRIVTANGYKLAPLNVDPRAVDGAVYALVHRETGRVYIGITRRKVSERWAKHFGRASDCRKLARAIRKYGADAFDRFVLKHGLSDEQLKRAEQELIKCCNANGEHGFNLTAGGEASPMEHPEVYERRRATFATPECKARQRAAALARHRNPELKAKLLEAYRARSLRGDWRQNNLSAMQRRSQDPEWIAKNKAVQRAIAPKFLWKHEATGRVFFGGQRELVEAFPDERLTQSNLSNVVHGTKPHHKGWRLAA